MLCFPNCKINIGLYITSKRPDGYHDLSTVFYPVKCTDALEVVTANTTNLHLSGLSVEGPADSNLVLKAHKMMQEKFPYRVGELDIYLHKAIPMGAGLGGGSADGTFMLRLLNDFYTLNLTDVELAAMGLQLGSDCPFFVYNKPCYAQGRGELLEPVTVDLGKFAIQVICPRIHVSTGTAFSMIKPTDAPIDLRKIAGISINEWRYLIKNDFEEPVFAKHPELQSIKDQLYEHGAIYASMSGSGSAIYGIFETGKKATIQSTVAFSEFMA